MVINKAIRFFIVVLVSSSFADSTQAKDANKIFYGEHPTSFGELLVDPKVIDSRGEDGTIYCGEPVLERLIGGAPETRAEEMRQVSPLEWLPWRIPQEYVVSSLRYPVTPPRPLAGGRTTMIMPDYPALARKAGDDINVVVMPDAGHFDFFEPGDASYRALISAITRILEKIERSSLAITSSATMRAAGSLGGSSGAAQKRGYVVETDSVVATRQPGPHEGGGETTGYSFFSDVPDLELVSRKRALHPGAAIGYHEQDRDEVYYILSGTGELTMNGIESVVGPGTSILTRAGSSHGLRQTGAADLVIIIVYRRSRA